MGIHKFKYNEKYILLDVNSSNVFDIDELTFDILDYYPKNNQETTILKLSDKYDENEIKECIQELDELVKGKYLFTDEIIVDKQPYHQGIIKAMCLHISHDCNLACKYCFAGGGDFDMKKEVMDFSTAKKAIDFLLKNSGNRKHLEVDFFGGEPLMNLEVVKQTVEYAKKEAEKLNKIFRFTLTTNAVLLDKETREYLNKEMYNIVLSIDGRKNVNDYMRPTLNNKGSYNLIQNNIMEMAKLREELGKDYYVRGTYTRNNLDFHKDVEHLSDIGVKEISLEAVVSPESEPYAIKESDLPELKKSYDKLTSLYLERKNTDKPFNFFHFNIDLDGGKCEYKKVSGCGAGCEYISVTPSGDIYPCHQFVGDEDFIMGNVTDGITNEGIRKEFYDCTLMDKEDCNNCMAKYFCGGGCHANAYNFNGKINSIYKTGCELLKKRIECSLYLYIKAKEQTGETVS